ncbi:MAG: type II CAAX prenyl endopeptidase Rce1 family protein, partial [Anaerolineales bacterium]
MNIPAWLSYTLLTILASAPFYRAIHRAGGAASEDFDRQFRTLMWIPGIMAFGIRFVKGMGITGIGLTAGRLPWLLLAALLIPFLMEILLITASVRFRLARLDPSMVAKKDGIVYVSQSVRLLLGNEPQSTPKFILNLLATITTGAMFMVVFSLAEEFGWRGFLQNEVIETFGLSGGLVLGGILWGIWQIPIVLTGYKFPGYPRLGAFVFLPIFTISAGIVTGWLYWLSGSIWVPAIFNASTKITSLISSAALGDAGDSRRVRIVWLWLWANTVRKGKKSRTRGACLR